MKAYPGTVSGAGRRIAPRAGRVARLADRAPGSFIAGTEALEVFRTLGTGDAKRAAVFVDELAAQSGRLKIFEAFARIAEGLARRVEREESRRRQDRRSRETFARRAVSDVEKWENILGDAMAKPRLSWDEDTPLAADGDALDFADAFDPLDLVIVAGAC